MVDEMDLLSGMEAGEPLKPQAFDEARAMLRAAMAVEDMPKKKTAARQRAWWGTRHKVGFRVTALAAAAAAAALVVVSTSNPQPAAPAGSSPLRLLAAHITASSGPLPGNASLIIRTQTEGSIPPQVSYNLYTDSGAFYGGGDKKSLMQAVTDHQNLADGITALEVKAALDAVTGTLGTARVQMVNASPNDLGLGLSPAAREKIWDRVMAADKKLFKEKGVSSPPPLPTGKTLQEDEDNFVWNNSIDALAAGAGNPQVRAGVLRLLSTISGVSVANSTIGGEPILTLTAGPEVFGGAGKQVLVINGKTGMPIKSWVGGLGPKVPPSVDTYKVLRVTMADIEAGKF